MKILAEIAKTRVFELFISKSQINTEDYDIDLLLQKLKIPFKRKKLKEIHINFSHTVSLKMFGQEK